MAKVGGQGNDALELVVCQVCFGDISDQTLEARQQHYEGHFVNDLSGGPSLLLSLRARTENWEGHQESPVLKKRCLKPLGNIFGTHKEEPFWYSALSSPPPRNYTPGMIPLLATALVKAVYISRETWDVTWGCGYRNFMMGCATLMDQQLQPLYFPLLDDPLPPGVRNLQKWIENAWEEGFDAQGHEDLVRLVNTKKWIGTSDLWVAFVSRGVPAELVDFDLEASNTSIDILINWIVAYFTLPSLSQINSLDFRTWVAEEPTQGLVTPTDRMPLILQHAGHSRTIVGFEVLRDKKINLLTFDPSKCPNASMRAAALSLSQNPFCAASSADTSTPSKKTPGPLKSPSSKHNSSKHRSLFEFFHTPDHPKRKFNVNSPSNKHKRKRMEIESIDKYFTPKSSKATPVSHGGDVIELFDDDDSDVEILPTPGEVPRSRGGDTRDVPKAAKPRRNTTDIWGDGLTPEQVLKFLRLGPHQLGQVKKKEYQILYFPMSAPLTESERTTRKVVRSTRVC
ncbi:hypothetical protein ONZ45_g3209 [Pleurotus djamor]|nr:hypothetical protein ONZ45_g3209 [Pleurotus djamor]